MQHHSVPICYFPGTALFIDDSRDFLLNFVLQLDEGLAYRVYDSPFDALDYIDKKHSEFEKLHTPSLTEFTKIRKGVTERVQDSVQLAAIHTELYNPSRFSEVSVVVVDFAMPGMDGLEFCRKIADTNIKRILLTGKADEKLAIEAFNEGLIDRFIQKNDPLAAELITKSIYELQRQYFEVISESISRKLSMNIPNCLHDKVFVEWFERLCQQHEVAEYYLADQSGSFILMDMDAKASMLMVKTTQQLQEYLKFAKEQQADAEILKGLSEGYLLPCHSEQSNLGFTWPDGLNAVTKAQLLEGDATYYYALVPGASYYDLKQDKILSYHRHLEEVDADELLIF